MTYFPQEMVTVGRDYSSDLMANYKINPIKQPDFHEAFRIKKSEDIYKIPDTLIEAKSYSFLDQPDYKLDKMVESYSCCK